VIRGGGAQVAASSSPYIVQKRNDAIAGLGELGLGDGEGDAHMAGRARPEGVGRESGTLIRGGRGRDEWSCP
jgi:hypothetical protein